MCYVKNFVGEKTEASLFVCLETLAPAEGSMHKGFVL